MSNQQEENRQFAMTMFCILSLQAESWAYMLKGKVHQEFKMKLENCLVGMKSLRKFIEEKNLVDTTDDMGEIFSQIMEYVKNAPTVENKCNIIEIIKEYVSGELKIVTPEQINTITYGENTQVQQP